MQLCVYVHACKNNFKRCIFFLRSVQKQVLNKEPNKLDPDSVQGILEICSKRFNPENEPYVYVSSRSVNFKFTQYALLLQYAFHFFSFFFKILGMV